MLPPDRAAHRDWLVSLTALPPGGTAVDLGCGRGEDLALLAAAHPQGAAFLGFDSSEKTVAAAHEALRDARVDVRQATLAARLPLDDASVDLVFSHNLLECLPDRVGFAREIARVLRPGGHVVVAHWDWDTQTFDGGDKARVRRLVHAFADWQQAWMAHADGWMGRRLAGLFNQVKELTGAVHARVLVNTSFAPGTFGHENAQAFRALVRRGLASADDCEGFLAEQEKLDARGAYFYSLTGYAYVGERRG